MSMHSPVHPGRLLGRELEARNISVSQAARDLGVSRQVLSGLINGRSGMTAEMALRVGHYIGSGPDVWIRMQASHDLSRARERMQPILRKLPTADSRAA